MWHVWGDKRGAYRVLVGRPKERGHLEDPGVDEVVLKWISNRWDGETLTGLVWFRIGSGQGRI